MEQSLSQLHGLFAQPISFQGLLDEIPLAAMVLDQGRRIVAMNRALEALTGFERGEVLGIRCEQVLRNVVCFENCPVCRHGFEAGETSRCLHGNIVNQARQKIAVSISIAPLRDADGVCHGYLETVEKARQAEAWSWRTEHAYRFGELIGNSPQIERIFQNLPMIGQTDSTVLLTGETGTGKDLVAEALHLVSDRGKGPFIKVNCGALPETLLESELFGHQKGAFTGATENKPGRFKLAHNGTLFLTEIGDLPLGLQTKLLTFLDDKTVYPLGSTQGFKVNVRIVAATLRDLEAMVQAGQFRSDLLFRLNVIHMHLPPLREREGDVRLLLVQFLRTFSEQAKKQIQGFSQQALDILLDYPYPGNVRELKNIVEYAVTFCAEEKIQSAHLPDYLRQGKTMGPGQTVSGVRSDTWPEQKTSDLEGQSSMPRPEVSAFPPPGTTWKEMERQLIMEALKQAKGNRGKTAKTLGWGRSTLWRKMKTLGLDS
jgi:two-component system, NtrC family, response regulator AtoC